MLSAEFIQKMKDRLQKERLEVMANIQEISQPEVPMDNPDEDDLANDAVEDILQGSSLAVLKNLLEKIDNALERIDNGTYGICQETGQDIPPAVLENEPWAEILPPIMRRKLANEQAG
jgi:DnaK suppressor protein